MPAQSAEKSVVSPVLIGRADLLATLDRLIAQVRGEIAVISGEAGVGKSRLVAEVKARAAALDWLILQGNSFEHDSALPYAPLLDLLRAFCATRSSDQVSLALGSTASDLIKLLPELADRLPELVPSPTLEPEQEKRRLFESIAQFILHLVSVSPVLIVIEDLHWSDGTSLEFLLHLARRVDSQPILLVLTYRSDEPNPSLTHFMAELDRGRRATELSLNRLSLKEVEAMLRAIFGPPQPIRTGFLETIYRLTEGNPFFVEEILKSLMMTGAIYFADDTWDRKPIREIDIPRSIQDAVQRRMVQLSEGARQTLTLAAVAGRRFDFALLQELVGMNEQELLQRLKELVAAQLVVEDSTDQFSFRHALTREATYSTLLRRERQRYHRTIAETMERIYVPSAAAHLADLSYHFYEGGVWQKALEYSQRAGEQAQALYAPREAIEHFTRALKAARELAAPIPPSLHRASGQAHETLGDFDAARADYDQALGAARAAQDGVAEWHILIDLGFLWAGRDYQQTGEFFQRATDLAQRLGDSKLHAQSLNRLANWFVNVGRPAEGLQTHRQALEIFERQEDRQGMADSLDLLGMAMWQLGDEIASYKEYRRAIDLFRELKDKRGLASALIGGSHASYWDETVVIPLQTMDENLRGTGEALNLTRQIGWAAGQAYSEWTTGVNLASFGDFGQALLHALESLRIATEIEHRQWIIGAHYSLGHIYVLMLLHDLAIQNLEIALPMARELGSAWWIGNITTDLAMAYLLKNEKARAGTVLNAALPRERQPRSVAERRVVWAQGQLALAQGEPESALHITVQLIETARESGSQRIPHLLKLKGECLAAQSRWDEAEQALKDAKQGARERYSPPLLWQIHRSLGGVYQRLKRVDKADTEFAAAREIIHSLAATIDPSTNSGAAMRDNFMSAALETLPKEKPDSPRRAAADKFGGLTAREREVARLVAHGKSNREIADALVLSERTVEYHVGNILSKLAFDSRSQIAVWAVEKGLGKGEA